MQTFLPIPRADGLSDALGSLTNSLSSVFETLSEIGYLFLIGGGFIAGVIVLFMLFTATRS